MFHMNALDLGVTGVMYTINTCVCIYVCSMYTS